MNEAVHRGHPFLVPTCTVSTGSLSFSCGSMVVLFGLMQLLLLPDLVSVAVPIAGEVASLTPVLPFSPIGRYGSKYSSDSDERPLGMTPSSTRQPLGRCAPRPPAKVSSVPSQDLRSPDLPVWYVRWFLQRPLRTRPPACYGCL